MIDDEDYISLRAHTVWYAIFEYARIILPIIMMLYKLCQVANKTVVPTGKMFIFTFLGCLAIYGLCTIGKYVVLISWMRIQEYKQQVAEQTKLWKK